jgi:hypothetical protein
MEKIQKDIKKISSGFPEQQVVIQSKTDWKEEKQRARDEAKKFFDEQKNKEIAKS